MHQQLLRHQPRRDGVTSEHSGKFLSPLSRASETIILTSAVMKLIAREDLHERSHCQEPIRYQQA
jgi:hypothetical protein